MIFMITLILEAEIINVIIKIIKINGPESTVWLS